LQEHPYLTDKKAVKYDMAVCITLKLNVNPLQRYVKLRKIFLLNM